MATSRSACQSPTSPANTNTNTNTAAHAHAHAHAPTPGERATSATVWQGPRSPPPQSEVATSGLGAGRRRRWPASRSNGGGACCQRHSHAHAHHVCAVGNRAHAARKMAAGAGWIGVRWAVRPTGLRVGARAVDGGECGRLRPGGHRSLTRGCGGGGDALDGHGRHALRRVVRVPAAGLGRGAVVTCDPVAVRLLGCAHPTDCFEVAALWVGTPAGRGPGAEHTDAHRHTGTGRCTRAQAQTHTHIDTRARAHTHKTEDGGSTYSIGFVSSISTQTLTWWRLGRGAQIDHGVSPPNCTNEWDGGCRCRCASRCYHVHPPQKRSGW